MLVLSVGALDAFLSELVIEVMPKLAASGSAQSIFNLIMRDNPGLILQAVYLSPDDLQRALADAIEGHFQAKSVLAARSRMRRGFFHCGILVGRLRLARVRLVRGERVTFRIKGLVRLT